jgi:transposase-like protein
MARHHYTDEQRANALAALAANGGNANRAAKELGIPVRTLRNWGKGDRHPEAAEMGRQKKARWPTPSRTSPANCWAT